jgi:UDP-N-acetylglucosamine 2-epimerase (non-hydrolysing)
VDPLKILSVLGTRPEIIRLSRVIESLDKVCNHVLVHTGQNFDPNLSDIFFTELGVRQPDHYLGIQSGSFGSQVGQLLQRVDEVLAKERPDRLLVLGDTNSGLSAILAKRRGIPVFHMEAGNRCFDDRVPEEINRRLIDHSSDILMPYTERSRHNLLREGLPGHRIFVTGNPILEVINHYQSDIASSRIHEQLGLKKTKYFLATIHRAENVDLKARLKNLMNALDAVQKEYRLPVIISLHPHTRQKLAEFDVALSNSEIRIIDPLGFASFIAMEQSAYCVLSDSGTVQEECCLFKVPNVTLRDTTERPETIECGSNILAGAEPGAVLSCVRTVLATPPQWEPPREYLEESVAATVTKILMGHQE